MKYKTNRNLEFELDEDKSYVYITDKGKDIGILMWHYKKKKWVYDEVK